MQKSIDILTCIAGFLVIYTVLARLQHLKAGGLALLVSGLLFIIILILMMIRNISELKKN